MTLEHREITLRAADGASLFAQRWAPKGEAKAEVLVIHGYAEHSGRYRELAEAFGIMNIATTAVDLRGHGTSSGRRGFVRRFEEYHFDIDAGFSLMQGKSRFLLGHSNGGLAALDYVALKQPSLAGLVVTSPLLGLPPSVPKAKILVGKIAGALIPTLLIPSGIDPSGISHDQAIVDAYKADPMVFTTAATGWFRAIQLAWTRIDGLSRVNVPLLFAYSGADRVVSQVANEAFAARIQSPDKTVWRREGEFHEILNETNRAVLHRQVGEWILKHAAV
jgi:acylglycerol lipase